MWEAWITVLSYRSRNISQKGRNRLRRSKKVYKHRGFRHRHTRDSQSWQHCVVIPLAKQLAGTKGKVERVKKCVVRRQGTEEGRTKVRFYVTICTNAMQLQVKLISHFLPVSSGFHFHTHTRIPFTSPCFHCTTHRRPWRHTSTRRITDITQ